MFLKLYGQAVCLKCIFNPTWHVVTAGSLVGAATLAVTGGGWCAPQENSTYLAGLLYLSTIVLCTKMALNLN